MATYEIKKENGYIRHYVTKANGEKVMIKETKLPKSKENEQGTGEMKDMITEMVMNQLTKVFDKEQFNKFSKTGIGGQKEKQLEKYSSLETSLDILYKYSLEYRIVEVYIKVKRGRCNMPYVHEFGIVACIEKDKEYIHYEPEKYDCIIVDGDLLDELMSKDFGEKMHQLDTFAHNTNRPYKNLAYFGITLIPPSSHKQFLHIVSEANEEYKSEELEELMKKITEAIKEDKWMIHFGI